MRVVRAGDILAPESWRERAERRMAIGGIAVLLATLFVLATQLLR